MKRLFLAPLLALSVLGAAPSRPALPELPASVYSRYGPVPVDLVKVVVCPDSTGVTDPRVIGCFHVTQPRAIQIADTLTLRWQYAVLFHEEAHVAFRDVGVHFDHPEDEETVAWAMARWRLGDLESRP